MMRFVYLRVKHVINNEPCFRIESVMYNGPVQRISKLSEWATTLVPNAVHSIGIMEIPDSCEHEYSHLTHGEVVPYLV